MLQVKEINIKENINIHLSSDSKIHYYYMIEWRIICTQTKLR